MAQSNSPNPEIINFEDAEARNTSSHEVSSEDESKRSEHAATTSQDNFRHPFTPDEHFYLEDGDIFVVVCDILFCVHRDKLASIGGKFAYLAKPEARVATEVIIYGLPLIRFPNLSVRHMRFLLTYIYDKIALSRTLLDGSDWLFWDAAISLLEVSHILDLPLVRKAALQALECLFPTSTRPTAFHPIIGGLTPERRDIFRRSYAFKAISLFRKTGVNNMLPMAFYHAAQMPLADILNGVMDGSERIHLSSTDIVIVLRGRETLRISRRRILFFWIGASIADYGPMKASPKCSSWRQYHGLYCYGFLRELFLAWERSRYLEGQNNALESLSPDACDVIKEHICGHCWEEIACMIDVGLESNWKRLPGYFGLPRRDDLGI